MDQEKAKKVWAILVEHAGARPEDGEIFGHYVRVEDRFVEWRFCGTLGFGGKLKYNGHQNDGAPWVDCYGEDRTPERSETILKVNGLLLELFGKAGS